MRLFEDTHTETTCIFLLQIHEEPLWQSKYEKEQSMNNATVLKCADFPDEGVRQSAFEE